MLSLSSFCFLIQILRHYSVARVYTISVVPASGSTLTTYVDFGLVVAPAALEVSAAIVYNVLGGDDAPEAGTAAAFTVQLRDSFGNGLGKAVQVEHIRLNTSG